jgi:hypothetical protein
MRFTRNVRIPQALICLLATVGVMGFVMAACSTHVERPPEEPEAPETNHTDEEVDGFNQDELGALDELLDGGVSAPSEAGSEPPPPPASSGKRPGEELRPAP